VWGRSAERKEAGEGAVPVGEPVPGSVVALSAGSSCTEPHTSFYPTDPTIMATLYTLDGDEIGEVDGVTFSDDESQVGFVIHNPGMETSFESSSKYRLELDDGTELHVLPHSGEGDQIRRRWACYVMD
jgi:hypothetical protein